MSSQIYRAGLRQIAKLENSQVQEFQETAEYLWVNDQLTDEEFYDLMTKTQILRFTGSKEK